MPSIHRARWPPPLQRSTRTRMEHSRAMYTRKYACSVFKLMPVTARVSATLASSSEKETAQKMLPSVCVGVG